MKIYSLAFLLFFLSPFVFPITDSQQKLNKNKPGVANIVFKSTDGGQTWQDISEGLPELFKDKPVKGNYVGRNAFFADANGLHLTAGNWIYQNKPNATAPFWEKEIFPDEHSSITPGKTGIFSYNYQGGGIFKKTNGTGVWSPVFTNFKEKGIRTVFETTGGTILIGADSGLFRSLDKGKTWKNVHGGGWVAKFVESNGVLMAGVDRNVIKSTDNGEHWELLTHEGGVAFDVEPIEGGVVANTFNSVSKMSRRITSYDGGTTWQPIDTDLPAKFNIFSFIRVGENLIGSHPSGIFRSSDNGKTWKLSLPSIEDKVFNLCVSGNVIYAIPRVRGC